MSSLRGHTDKVSVLAWCPSLQRLYSGSWDNTIRVWDLERKRCVGCYVGHTESVYGLCVSPEIVISGSFDRTLRIWSPEAPDCVLKNTLEMPRFVWSVVQSTRIIFAGLSGGDIQMLLRQPGLGAQVGERLTGHTDDVEALNISPSEPCGSEEVLLSASSDKSIRLWELQSLQCLHILDAEAGIPTSLAFKVGSKVIACCHGGKFAAVWDLAVSQTKKGASLKPQKHIDTELRGAEDGDRCGLAVTGQYIIGCGIGEAKLHL